MSFLLALSLELSSQTKLLPTIPFFQPRSENVLLEQSLSRLIREGYIHRNPTQIGYWKTAKERVMRLGSNSKIDPMLYKRNSTLGMALTGYSGTGKSTSLRHTLQLGYPQVICHSEYNNMPFPHIQVVWLMVDCPHDGLRKQLCLNLLKQLDQLLGTDYERDYGKYGRATVDAMISGIGTLANVHSIGALVIDEVQRINSAKNGGEALMMDFLIQLINDIGVPIVMAGTPDADSLFAKKFSMARRATGQGNFMWKPMENDGEWEMFMESMWEYQYTSKPTQLTPEFIDLFHDLSQGILDVALKLYALVQLEVITMAVLSGDDHEIIDQSVIETVYDDSFTRLKPMLDAMRKGDWHSLSRYADLTPIDLDAHVQQAVLDSARAKLLSERGKVARQPKPTKPSAKKKSRPKTKKSRYKKGDTPPKEWLLGTLTFEAKRKEESVHDTLLNAGYIKSPFEFDVLEGVSC